MFSALSDEVMLVFSIPFHLSGAGGNRILVEFGLIHNDFPVIQNLSTEFLLCPQRCSIACGRDIIPVFVGSSRDAAGQVGIMTLTVCVPVATSQCLNADDFNASCSPLVSHNV